MMRSLRTVKLLLALLAAGATAHACSCASPRAKVPVEFVGLELPRRDVTPGQLADPRYPGPDYAKARVFVGRMVAAETNGTRGMGSRRMTFEVEEALVGRVGREVDVFTAASGSACGWTPPKGQRVIVFATVDGERDRLRTGLCTRSSADEATVDRYADFLRGFREKATGAFDVRYAVGRGSGVREDVTVASYSLRKGRLDGAFSLRDLDGEVIAAGTLDGGERTGDWLHGYPTYESGAKGYITFRDTYVADVLERRAVAASTGGAPYAQIPREPYELTAGTTVARVIDGLGFRYYWASEGLRPADLTYRPTPEARSTQETLEHLYGLSEVLYNVALDQDSRRPLDLADRTYEALRSRTLHNLKLASRRFDALDEATLLAREVRFVRDGVTSASPFWNLLNGPLADALYHTGQVVTLRRAAGNPIAAGVNVFRGVKEP